MQENYVNNDEEEEYVNFTDDMIPEEGDFSNINNGNNDVNKNKIDFANSNNINYKVYNFPSTNEKKCNYFIFYFSIFNYNWDL